MQATAVYLVSFVAYGLSVLHAPDHPSPLLKYAIQFSAAMGIVTLVVAARGALRGYHYD